MENHIQRKRRCAFNVLFSLGRSPNFECVFKGGFYPVLSLLISDFFGHCGRCHFKMKHLEWVRFFYELILLLFCRLYFHIFLSSKPEGECWTISSGFFFQGLVADGYNCGGPRFIFKVALFQRFFIEVGAA